MSLREKFVQLLDSARDSVAYWLDIAITDFTRDLSARMKRENINHGELAKRLGTSRPNVTQLLSGSNFTLETMTRLAMAVDGVVRIHIADRDARTVWYDDLRTGDSEAATLVREVTTRDSLTIPLSTSMKEEATQQRVSHA